MNKIRRLTDYKITDIGDNETLCPADKTPDYDIIRSVDVLLEFMKNVCHHRKGKDYTSIVFVIGTGVYVKEFFIIPVKSGMEKIISSYASDRISDKKQRWLFFSWKIQSK